MFSRLLAPGTALLAGLPLLIALLLLGPSCGHDFDFHLQSWLAVERGWRQGVLAPQWVLGANYGAGEARLLFYPPLSWLLGAILGAVLPWSATPDVFTGMCLAGAALAMFFVARRRYGPAPACAAALLYAESPYLLFTAVERSAYSELMAAVWMPLLVGALLRPKLPVLPVSLSLALLWYTNAPAGVMGCYLILLALVWGGCRAAWQQRWNDLWSEAIRGVAALALGCALAADYLIPAWYEQRWVEIGRAVGPGMRVADSFLFEHTGQAFHDQVLHTASSIGLATLAVGLLTGAVYGFAALKRRRDVTSAPEAPGRVLSRGPLVATGTIAGFLLFAVFLITLLQFRPSLPVWHALPELRFLQFPWRLLLLASVCVALLIGGILPTPRSRRARVGWVGGCLLWTASMTAWSVHTLNQPCDDEDRVSAQLPLSAHGGFEGTDEYTPRGSDNGEIQQGLPLVRLLRSPDADEGDDSSESNPAWQRQLQALVPGSITVLTDSPDALVLRVRPRGNAWAVLRREDWPAARIVRDGARCAKENCRTRTDGLIAVFVAAGHTTTIAVQLSAIRDIEAGRALSLLAAFAAAGALFVSLRRRARNSREGGQGSGGRALGYDEPT